MGRKKIPRRLPPLPKALAFPEHEHKQALLLEMLRDFSKSIQTNQEQVFYAMKDVAKKFKVPSSLVAKVYGQLESERLLRRIRGKATVLEGVNPSRVLSVRAMVLLAVSMSCLMALHDYRIFFIQIRRALRRRDFAVGEVFYETRHKADDLLEWFKAGRADKVIWYCPDGLSKDLALRLKDMGVPVIGVADGAAPGIHCQYDIDRRPAITRIASEWKKDGIEKVKIGVGDKRLTPDEQRVGNLLTALDWEIEFVVFDFKQVDRSIESFISGPNCGTMLLNSAASPLLVHAPGALKALATACRLALLDGPVGSASLKPDGALADMIVTDWQAVASRVVEDLLKNTVPDQKHPLVFESEGVMQVPLASYPQQFEW